MTEKKLEEAKVNQKENKDKKKKKELKKLTTEAEEELKKLSKTTKKVQKECMESLKHVRAVAKRKPKKGLLRTLTAAKPKVGVHKLMFKKRLWTELILGQQETLKHIGASVRAQSQLIS